MALPFYGAANPRLFAIEREAMDRPGRVLAALDRLLPSGGTVADVGAGDGFTAQSLSPGRKVLAVEPAGGMRRPATPLPWIAGVAQSLPLRSAALDAAYSTWAYFFTGPGWDPTPGVEELHRVVAPGGPLLVVDNLGGDEFTALGDAGIASVEQWASFGFECQVIDTEYRFRNTRDAGELLTYYFGDLGLESTPLAFSYRVGLFSGVSRGPRN